ncbi:ABC transporter ATP-binding protein [Salipiger mucosus]|uniref:ABC transporter domain-containing protein n=1 Tax=Salipiger mucosus DSM 16094 TaxID=1123237 RepID=S9RKK7_9RHOB|nr:ATP-binding cassette domain-containing protein [Salipiger mucosus]EPX78645.1 hypothetical protein Salmuc_04226 [Salipiger mucosus DSM 16094]
MTPILDCRNLTVAYGPAPTVSDVSFALKAGECLALVGASGSGKSTIARAVLGLHGPSTRVSGRIGLSGHDLRATGEVTLSGLRGRLVGYVAQDPYAACDPLRTVGHHVGEAWRSRGMNPAPGEVVERLRMVGIDNAPHFASKAPHCWSGGMLQRACIAAASAHAPPLMVADEPTSALDPRRGDEILTTLRAGRLCHSSLISHHVDLVRRHADRVAILHEGRLVDDFPVSRLDDSHRHAVTRRLTRTATRWVSKEARAPGEVLLTARNVTRSYAGTGRTIGPFSFRVRAGAAIGLSGSSGSGKSTILRMIAGLDAPDEGQIDLAPALRRRGAIMPVFQNPAASLNPFWPIWRTISEPASASKRIRTADRKALARRLLGQVGLERVDIEARPDEVSLGQCQRIAIARAIAANPLLLVADEPTSALDTVARAQVADLLAALVRDGMALAIASHDPWIHDRLNAEVVSVH